MTAARRLGLVFLIAVMRPQGAWAQAVTLSPLCKLGSGAPADACGPRDSLIWVGANRFPVYPGIMRAAGIPGDVDVTFRLGTAGYVEANTIHFVRSTHRVFETEVTRALIQWRFEHVAVDASRAADSLAIRVRFLISESCPDTVTRSSAVWLPDAWPPEVIVSGCQNVLVPRDGVG